MVPLKVLQKRCVGLKPLMVKQNKTDCLFSHRIGRIESSIKIDESTLILNRKEWENNKGAGKDGHLVRPVIVDSFICNKLRQHQKEGICFLYECIMGLSAHNHFGAILADDMGLG